jgi:hypothetical protein
MKLGTSKDALPAFIEQQVKQMMPNNVAQQTSTTNTANSAGSANAIAQEK